MSLEDRFYPEDGSNLTRFDNNMIKTSGKIGNAYQQLTGRSYKDLVKNCYKTSTAGFGIGILSLHFSSIVFGFLSLNRLKSPLYNSPLEEELMYEAKGSYKKMGKLLRVGVGMATPHMFCLYPSILMGGMEDSNYLAMVLGAGGIIEGLSIASFSFAEYLTKADVPKPPKKTVWKRTKEKAESLLSPQGLPEPVKLLLKV